MIARIAVFLLLASPAVASEPWQVQTLKLINEARADANIREFAIYGEVLEFREPLVYDPVLEESSQWWCDALNRSGWWSHFGQVNERGFLVDTSGDQISRVWLPSQADGLTYWGHRLRNLGVPDWQFSSENGVLLKRVTAEGVVSAWKNRGWNIDPRAVTGSHYFNLINPSWTRFGVAQQNWGSGKRSVFGGFR